MTGGSKSIARLTPAELRVYYLLATTPDTQKQIARTLNMRVKTINCHAKSIYTKLGYHGRHQVSRRCALILDHFVRTEPPTVRAPHLADACAAPSLTSHGDGANFTVTQEVT